MTNQNLVWYNSLEFSSNDHSMLFVELAAELALASELGKNFVLPSAGLFGIENSKISSELALMKHRAFSAALFGIENSKLSSEFAMIKPQAFFAGLFGIENSKRASELSDKME